MAASFHPDTALLNIGMPDLTGYEVARRLRQPWGERIRPIALPGWGQDRDRRQALEAGFDLHVSKPVDPHQLEALIRNGPATTLRAEGRARTGR